jgi:hypothetical protein
VPAFTTVNAPQVTRQQAIDAVVDRVRTFYDRFNVSVVTTRPSSGDYTMVAVGGSHTVAGQPTGVAGVSPLDCTNSNLDNVVFDFSEDQIPMFGGVVAVAITAAHESGHAFGLEHTDNPADIMYSVAMSNQTIDNLFNISFTTGDYSSYNAGDGTPGMPMCGRSNPVDNAAILDTNVGANSNPGDTTPPGIGFTFPILSQVPTTIPLQFTASDNVGVVRLELYKDLELIAVLTTPPYQTTITANDGDAFYLTIESIDANANRSSLTRPFLVSASMGALCPSGTCTDGKTCKEGICRVGLGAPCTQTIDCTTDNCKAPTGSTTKICTQSCSAAHACPAGFTCGSDLVCAPTPLKKNGDMCAAGTECMSGLCGGGVCVPACDATGACVLPLVCQAVDGGMGCVLAQDSTPSPTTQPMGSSGCDAAPGAHPSPLVFLWLAPLVARRLRGRSRRSVAG